MGQMREKEREVKDVGKNDRKETGEREGIGERKEERGKK